MGQPQGRDQVAHSAFATLGSEAGTSSHCGAVKNLMSPCAVFTCVNRESSDQSRCVSASLPASSGLYLLPSAAASGFVTGSVWSTSL